MTKNKKPENPPAFPSEKKDYYLPRNGDNVNHLGSEFNDGINMADYFAARAMNRLISTYPLLTLGPVDMKFIAQKSYDIADAMLTERQRRKDESSSSK